MKKLKDRTVSKVKVSQKYNLGEALGIDLTGNKALKERIGQFLIDEMLKRTSSSKDVSNMALKRPYSKKYKDSKEYEQYGKTGKVNMELTGNMLGDIDISKIKSNEIEIAITDTTEKKKAYRHISGDDNMPTRDFFGFRKEDWVKMVKKEFESELKSARKRKPSTKLSDAALALRALNAADDDAIGSLVNDLLNVQAVSSAGGFATVSGIGPDDES